MYTIQECTEKLAANGGGGKRAKKSIAPPARKSFIQRAGNALRSGAKAIGNFFRPRTA